MREIKFRAWDSKNNQMIYDWIKVDEDMATCLSGNFCNIEELMQYTGLHDKNGKEIYEGDIVRVSGVVGLDWIIEYRTNQAAFILCQQQDTPFQHTLEMYNTNMRFYEVIGNIWENKELLNENIS